MDAVVVSVNVARPRAVEWRGRRVTTAFFKEPRAGPCRAGPEGLEGDQVGDPRVHGGPRKAVYAYPSEHYPFWESELGASRLPWGSFGENLTLRGVTESDVRPGDRLDVGTARLEVTRSRTPCYKLNVRFDRDDMVRRFARAARPGFYLAVIRSGTLAAGDRVRVVAGKVPGPTVRERFLDEVRGPVDPSAELDDP